jgi:diaminohydroxyphosphoribosylaminopyrimidine deaminase/5-amino-6-(5-phosphoribosylamino)uracil reductase
MTVSANDYRYMARALQLAERGLNTVDPNPRVGCVIVNKDEIVGEGWHERAGEHHAELRALQQAGAASAGATAYVTLEPCCHHGRTPPCTDALLSADISRVIIATMDANPSVSGSGVRQLAAAGVHVETGVMSVEARSLNAGFFRRMEIGRPYVRSKIAVSLDGRTALANGTSQWITGDAAREDAQRWRARSSAIMTGAGTIEVDDPSLNVRLDEFAYGAGSIRQPMRVIVDSRLRIRPDSRTLSLPGDVRVFCIDARPEARSALEAAGAIIEETGAHDGRVALSDVMTSLAALEINEVLVEAGAVLNGALLQAGMMDELIVYMASHILGQDGLGMFAIPELQAMSSRVELELCDIRRVGVDCRMTYRPR